MNLFIMGSRRNQYRLMIRGIAIFLGVVSSFAISILCGEKMYIWAILPTVVVLIAAIIEFILGDVLTEKRFPARTEKIIGNYREKVSDIHDLLIFKLKSAIESLEGCDKNKINATIHLLVEIYSESGSNLSHAYMQITNYAGQLGGNPWRLLDVSKGIIGRCYRTRKPEYVNFRNKEEYAERMVKEFGFTADEIEKHTMSARSYFTYPIFLDNEFIGIIYLFSIDPQVFPNAVDLKRFEEISSNIIDIIKSANII